MRVMLDTNILVSIIFFPSRVTKTFISVLSDKYRIVICDYVIEELRLVTLRKFPDKLKFLNQFFVELPFDLVYTPQIFNSKLFPYIRDSKDSPILAAAILENIDVFVTGDKDFLVLNVDVPQILTMTEFINTYK